MKIPSALFAAAITFCIVAFSGTARGQSVFQDNFDDQNGALRWLFNRSTGNGDSSVDFAYNYADIGIPAAPRSNGSTFGMRFLVNQGLDPLSDVGEFQGISASPIDQHFAGDFRIRFDLWMNVIGPFPGGGSGSTQSASFGLGTSGATVQWAGEKHSAMFAVTGDGGSTQDYRAYLRELAASAGATIDPALGVYAAGSVTGGNDDARSDTNAYYNVFGEQSAPPAQLADFPGQTGMTRPGAFGMAWRDVVIEKSGNTVTWTADGILLATVPIETAVFGGDNIFFGMFDINGTASTDPNDFLGTAIFDNIEVQVIPEPTTFALIGMAAGILGIRRSRR